MQFRMMLAAAAAAMLAACGGGDSGETTETTPPGTLPPAATRSDVSAEVAVVAEPAVAGGMATYTVRIANAGPDVASDVPVQLQVDAAQRLKVVTCAATGGAVCPSTLGAAMSVSTLPSGGQVSFSIATTVSADAAGFIGLTITAQAANDPVGANDSVQATTEVVAPNLVSLQSESSDFIGQGSNYSYSNANSLIGVSARGGLLEVNVDGDQVWSATFLLPAEKSRLEPGTYTGLTRWPFHNVAAGGLDWHGDGRGCNALTGSLTVEKAIYSGDTLKLVDLHFEQHCEGAAPALRGSLHWSAYDDTVAPGPVMPIPAGLWQPLSENLPITGNYVYLTSESGDWIGRGATLLYTPETTAATWKPNGASLAVDIAGWSATFAGGNGLSRLEPGFYGELRGWPFHNPVKGGLSWTGNGNGCMVSGWFAVDSVTYNGPSLAAIDIRFEQRCEGFSAALRGKIHWTF